LGPFGILFTHLVQQYGRSLNIVVIWYYFPVLVCLNQEKSGNPGFFSIYQFDPGTVGRREKEMEREPCSCNKVPCEQGDQIGRISEIQTFAYFSIFSKIIVLYHIFSYLFHKICSKPSNIDLCWSTFLATF
jgi:hypothetical protein